MMKKNIIYIIGVVLCTVLFCACSGEKPKTNATVEVEKPSVYGESAKFFSVVPDAYQLEYTDTSLRIKVKLRLDKSVTEGTEVSSYPKLELLDDAGENCCGSLSLSNEEKFDTFLHSAVGTTEDFLFLTRMVRADDVTGIMDRVREISIEKLKFSKQFEDLLDKAADLNESITNEDLEEAVEAGKAAIEVSKSALDLLNQLSK